MSRSDHSTEGGLRRLDDAARIFDAVFTVAPLLLVGTYDPDGSVNLAPKHMAMPLGWSDRFGFVCTPRHRTYANVERTGVFTAGYVRPDQVVMTGQAAAERGGDDARPELSYLPTVDADEIDAPLLAEAHAGIECRLTRIVEEGDASIILGKIVAAHARPGAIRGMDRDDADILNAEPLVAYVTPGRLARIDRTTAFPYPARFSI